MGDGPRVQPIPPSRLGENRQKETIIGMCVATSIASLIVFVRIFARAVIIRQFGWDDFVITIAMVSSPKI